MKRRTSLKVIALGAVATRIPFLIADESPAESEEKVANGITASDASILASIQIYNPTRWTHPIFVEVPSGQLAAPGLIDWHKVRLLSEGRDIPFSLREGRVHWRASLAPVVEPRPEDLIVFTASVPANTRSKVEVSSGLSSTKSALTLEGIRLLISYPGMRVVIDKASGMLIQLEAFGEELLDGPMRADFFRVEEGVIEWSGVSPSNLLSYTHPTVRLKRGSPLGPPQAKLVSHFSNAALSELNFLLQSEGSPAMALTYRVRPGGLVEISADERPWEGASPWLGYGVSYWLALRGKKRRLPHFETVYPLYGFKDYPAVLHNVGTLHEERRVTTVEIGEEAINGRRWSRRLYAVPQDKLAHIPDLLQLLHEGPVVETVPYSLRIDREPLRVFYPAGCEAIAAQAGQALKSARVRVSIRSGLPDHQKPQMVFQVLERPEEVHLEGDGYAIQPLADGTGVSLVSGTRFGLMMGALKLADHLRKAGPAASLPLMADNPGIDLRASGFGGAPNEADFTYGNEHQWTAVFDSLIASGMNRVTCQGMWGNWAMPVTYKYMPEIQSSSPNAYDPVSGTKFTEFDSYRERGRKLSSYLRDRGVKVWLWVPIGCIPTTFAEKFPDAVLPGNPKIPLVLAPKYREYLRAFFKEVLETYRLDGFALCRDDNGGIDTSEAYRKYLATSRTKNPVWEQVLMIHNLIRDMGFNGDVAFYPYRDFYTPSLESVIPKDLFVVGHGSGFGTLTRRYTVLGPMGNTWLDNIYSNFRVPPTARMKLLISDRGTYWIGGAFRGMEMPWWALGAFTWRSATTVSTLRHDWGRRAFGETKALAFLRFDTAYERLWTLMNGPLLPYPWVVMSASWKKQVEQECQEELELFRKRLAELRAEAGNEANQDWFDQVSLYPSFFEYCLHRLEFFGELYDTVLPYKDTLEASEALPADVRRRIVPIYRRLLESAEPYAEKIRKVPGSLMRATEPSARPYKEWWEGGYYHGALDKMLALPQFSGTLTVSHQPLRAGRPFTLTVELFNRGICPWVPSEGHVLQLSPAAEPLGLPRRWELKGDWVLPGDRRVVKLSGTASEASGTAKIGIKFWSPSGPISYAFINQEVLLQWE